MSKSVLVMETPENCYVCPFGTAYCSALEYEGLCELADCLDCDVILMTEEHYDCESKDQTGVRLWICQKKTMEIIQLIRLMLALQKDGTSVLMRLQEE